MIRVSPVDVINEFVSNLAARDLRLPNVNVYYISNAEAICEKYSITTQDLNQLVDAYNVALNHYMHISGGDTQ
jgi:hypothetical protein